MKNQSRTYHMHSIDGVDYSSMIGKFCCWCASGGQAVWATTDLNVRDDILKQMPLNDLVILIEYRAEVGLSWIKVLCADGICGWLTLFNGCQLSPWRERDCAGDVEISNSINAATEIVDPLS